MPWLCGAVFETPTMLYRAPTEDAGTRILFVRHLPARLSSQESAALLGFPESAISILVREKLLKPLGSGPKNTVKYFARIDIERLAVDGKWLDKATRAIRRTDTSKRDNARNDTTGFENGTVQ